MIDALKATIDEIGRNIQAFRAAQDAADAEIKKFGAASAESKAAADRANASITALEAKLEETRAQLREVETAAARVNAGGTERADRERVEAAQFYALTRGQTADPSAADVQAYRDYRRAFVAYMRRDSEPLTPDLRAALSVGSSPEGGFWVPPDTSGRIVRFVEETSPMRQHASVQPISTDTLEGVYDLEEADSGWVSETGSRSETTSPKIGKWSIPVHEQYAEPRATQKVLDDAVVDVEAWLASKVGEKLARKENNAFVLGDGVGKPRGFTTYASATPSRTAYNKIEQTNTGAAGAFAASAPGDVFITAIGLMKESLLPGAVWAMSRSTKAAVRKLKDADGSYLMVPDFRDGFKEMLLGISVVGFEDMAAIAANSLSIALANFREGYQIVDRLGIRVLRDPLTSKPYVKFYTTKRVGGDVVNYEAIKLIKFAA